jgi:hypothetical protein
MEITVMKKQISIVLAAGLLMVGVATASSNEMSKMSPRNAYGQHNIYAGHSNSKGQQHAALTRVPAHNVDID